MARWTRKNYFLRSHNLRPPSQHAPSTRRTHLALGVTRVIAVGGLSSLRTLRSMGLGLGVVENGDVVVFVGVGFFVCERRVAVAVFVVVVVVVVVEVFAAVNHVGFVVEVVTADVGVQLQRTAGRGGRR